MIYGRRKKQEVDLDIKKQVAFDLDTDALKKYYPSESWNNAYDVIKRHMTNNGFSWLQGLLYVSQESITSTTVTDILDESCLKKSMAECMYEGLPGS